MELEPTRERPPAAPCRCAGHGGPLSQAPTGGGWETAAPWATRRGPDSTPHACRTHVPGSGVIVPLVFVEFPSTVLLPRDFSVALLLKIPTALFVTVEFETRTVAPVVGSMPASLLFATRQASIFNSALDS